jgi:hypothetical protein
MRPRFLKAPLRRANADHSRSREMLENSSDERERVSNFIQPRLGPETKRNCGVSSDWAAKTMISGDSFCQPAVHAGNGGIENLPDPRSYLASD